ncbi:hypothetical protein P8452_64133 [Trifolium repens]|nr:hypothetical protein P8452_64133 [Trifolium repens]
MGKHYRPAGKKKEGNAAKFVTRTQAIRLLQISLPLFRKLCILKAIRVHERKIKKAEAKKNFERANRLREKTPKPKIDRIIRQRYP